MSIVTILVHIRIEVFVEISCCLGSDALCFVYVVANKAGNMILEGLVKGGCGGQPSGCEITHREVDL